ncbi:MULTISPECIES: SDR family NAD(P)-dependent oxidoreductase [unclassified Ketobacter]|uniref:SDR family NAD(P)-dependent oxidoreductase n=1 Tax=unclassified Ketobacter TaxID=2639109 RepID=UPI000F18D069|nr:MULTISPECIES: SDR family NAD(P)-dependent oxidoreductase [unclassified Ketobacter]RLT87886.1 MAG: SDR family NAD(P)-dependent oxidoreductase [Ketobacter sp. GenoA1]RLT96450.1 MAG: SDR family NAD(P)-dependent oxidoreductase [Ketobacter sp.]
MKSFNNKVAAITGAASGIGRALALELAKQHCHLALCDVDDAGLAETAKQASALGVKVTTAKVNVADRDAVHAWADQVVHDHGKVNMVYNNAGVALGGTVEDTDYSDYEWIVGINMWGVVYGTKAFLPYIKQAGEEGHIVNISSIFGLFAQPTQSGYNMSKFAVRGFTESLRQELDLEGGKVSCTCVHPGGIKTNIARNARMSNSVEKLTGSASAEKMRDQFEALFLTTSEKAAQVILGAVKANKRRALIGPDARVLDIMQRTLPVIYQRIVTASFKMASR